MTPLTEAVGSANGNGSPWWLTAILRLGVTAVIALGLVWFIVQDVKRDLLELRESAAELKTASQAHAAVTLSNELLNKESSVRQDVIIRILVAMCVNMATNEDKRTRCIQN